MGAPVGCFTFIFAFLLPPTLPPTIHSMFGVEIH
jgi:hypothetical protein